MPYRDLQTSDLIKFQLDPEGILDSIERTLRGQIFDDIRQDWIVPKGGVALMNEKGVTTLMNVVIRPRVNKNVYLTNLSEPEIKKIMYKTMLNIVEKLFVSRKEYEIEKDNLDVILHLIEDNLLFALNRSLDEGERNFLKTTESVKEIRTVGGAQPPKRSLFNRPKLGGG
ncbi:hypothetical protein CMI37_23015 [Candidatus Pacearchaeota archaeon]|nr:hypothetical protein [Candidatus Pacearchaeota archaeon]|tara:strand:- start:2589 stop:3098 length:510 start_codon:yes stop_codon:yes gene_type:complete